MVVASHVTSCNQSALFQRRVATYTSLKFVHDTGCGRRREAPRLNEPEFASGSERRDAA